MRTFLSRAAFIAAAALALSTSIAPRSDAQVNLAGGASQNFDTLASTGTGIAWSNNVTLPGWYSTRTTYNSGTGSSNAGAQYSFGVALNSERALGSVGSGSTGTVLYGIRLVNNTGAPISALFISYTGEQWRNGGSSSATPSVQQKLDFQYQVAATAINAGTWSDFDSLDFAGPVFGTTASAALIGNDAANRTALSATLAVNVANNQEVWLRWSDIDNANNDHGLGIDDFSVSVVSVPTGVGAASPANGVSGASTTLTVTVTPGTGPASTGLTVTGNVSAIGGSATQTFYDDGATGGDVNAGDNVFTWTETATGTPGAKSLPFTVADGQSRSSSGSISYSIDAPFVAIHDIQGSGTSSPYAGQLVRTAGIVTARKFNNGFFIQTADADADGSTATSQGIFVFTSVAPNMVAVGDAVTIQGTIVEFVPSTDSASPPITEFSNTGLQITVNSSGNTLPTPVTITAADTDPNGSIQQLEKYEGMRVFVASLTVSAPTGGGFTSTAPHREADADPNSNGTFYGVLTGIDRPFREAGIETPSTAPSGSPCCVPFFDANPERLRVDSDGQPQVFPGLDVTTGVVVTNMTGVLDYGLRTYTVLPDALPTVTANATAIPATDPTAGQFTVSGANFQRFFDDTNDPVVGEPVLTTPAYQGRLQKVSNVIRNQMKSPDVIGVVEIENLTVLQAIAAKVNADAVADSQPDPGYSAYLAEGNDPGGIDVGFLVRSRVTVDSVTQYGLTTTFVDPGDASVDILNDRPPLVLVGRVNHGSGVSAAVTVIVNHLRSLNSVEEDSATGRRVREKRRLQAEFLADLVQSRQVANPNERIVLVGDFNAFQFSDGYVDVMGTITGAPTPEDEVVLASEDLVDPNLINLLSYKTPEQRYSYTFDGNAQVLDHGLINTAVECLLDAAEHPRVNADFPVDYYGDFNRPERISDHDPLVAYFRFPTVITADDDNICTIGVTAPGSDASLPFSLRALITDPANSFAGDLCNQTIPVTVTLTPVAPGPSYSVNAVVESCDANGMVIRADFSGIAVNVYDVTFTLCHGGTTSAVLAVFDPSLGFTTGGGRTVNPNTGNEVNFGFTVKYAKKGVQGSVLFIEHVDTDLVIKAKSHTMKSLSIVGNEAVILTKNAVVTPEAGAEGIGGYSLRVRAIDNGEPGSSDQYGLQVTDPDGVIVVDLTFDPQTLVGGNIQVPQGRRK
jgi:uncharacterized protein